MRTQATMPPRLTALHPQRHALVGLNVLGGLAVLGSYAYEITAHAGTSEALWGAVPDALRPFYTISMVMAAIGYFPLTLFLLFGVDPDRTRIGGRFGYGVLVVLYALILVPSALWMPLTFAMVEQPGAALWVAIPARPRARRAGIGGAARRARRPDPAGLRRRVLVGRGRCCRLLRPDGAARRPRLAGVLSGPIATQIAPDM